MQTMYYIISLKWTNKNDKWITLWRHNRAGYAWFVSMAGKYTKEEAGKKTTTVTIISTDAAYKYLESVNYEGNPQHVLPNSKEVRDLLGITKNDLLAIHKTTN